LPIDFFMWKKYYLFYIVIEFVIALHKVLYNIIKKSKIQDFLQSQLIKIENKKNIFSFSFKDYLLKSDNLSA